MHFIASLLAVGSVASLASASFQFPDSVPMSKRQTSGPAYECHANCGYAIQDSANSGYCTDEKWLGLLKGCLKCANQYNIWRYYGDKVGAAAQACGLDATPEPATAASGAASSASSAAPASPSSEVPATTSSEAPAASTGAPASASVPTTEQPTSASQPGASQPATESSTAAQTTPPSSRAQSSSGTVTTASAQPTTTGAGSPNGTSTNTVPAGAAAGLQQPAILALGAIAAFAVNMI